MQQTLEAPAYTAESASNQEVVRSMNAVRSLVRALRIDARWIEDTTGISLAQIVVLEKLCSAPARSIVELAGRTGTHASSVSVVVKRLVERARDEIDRRQVQFAVTDAGREFLRGVPRTVESHLVDALGAFDGPDAERLANLLERWVKTAGIELMTNHG